MTSLHISNWVRCEFGPFIQTNPPEKPCWNIICRKTTKLIDWEHKLILNEPYAMHIFHSFSYRKTTKRLYHVIADKWINRYLIQFTQSNMLANPKWKTQTKRTEKKEKNTSIYHHEPSSRKTLFIYFCCHSFNAHILYSCFGRVCLEYEAIRKYLSMVDRSLSRFHGIFLTLSMKIPMKIQYKIYGLLWDKHCTKWGNIFCLRPNTFHTKKLNWSKLFLFFPNWNEVAQIRIQMFSSCISLCSCS